MPLQKVRHTTIQESKSRPLVMLGGKIMALVLLVFLFLITINVIGLSFSSLGENILEHILIATANPFVSLFIGLILTAVIQSSSTTTSMIVAVVASGAMSFPTAVPMIMGANIGTTLTSSIVALSFITDKKEFSRAIAAGTIHDFFNILTVIVLFPLEYYYGFLSLVSQRITDLILPMIGSEGKTDFTLIGLIIKPVSLLIVDNFANKLILILIAFLTLFASIKLLSKILFSTIMGNSEDWFKRVIFKNPFQAFTWGTILTMAVQSSSVTTPLIVPIVALEKLTLKKAYPFIVGANIGTTITALMAAMFKTDQAVSIAITHFTFNLCGVLLFFTIRKMRVIPIFLASYFGNLTQHYRFTGLIYIVFTFFALPFSLIYFNKADIKEKELVYTKKNLETGDKHYKLLSVKTVYNNKFQHWFVYDNLSQAVIPADNQPDKNYDVHVKNNILILDETFYLKRINSKCWNGEDVNGKFTMCLQQQLSNFKIENGKQFDSVNVYTKRYQNPPSQGAYKTKYYLDREKYIFLKKEYWNKNNKLIEVEELTAINP